MTINNRLKLALLPLDISQASKDANLQAAAELIKKIDKDTDLIVLPELFSTGFIAGYDEAMLLAEPCGNENDKTFEYLAGIASESNMAICSSYLKLDSDGRPANHALFIEPSGEFAIYRKHHLFGLSKESEVYSAGQTTPPVVRFRGWNISMVICYDLRFPTWCRNRNLRYDLLLIPANWPDARRYAWEHLLIARAIENQAAVAGADRGGSDDYGTYTPDMSAVYDATGKRVSTAGDNGVVYATLQKDQLEKFRSRFPFYKDAD
ncbi:MAG: nitrilase family protein [Muribaculaceae bacterium]|nr:nitrilase family protein [Muribaculaceae bacterium]